LLEKKRDLAARVVGSGEAWITELGEAELRELFTLSAAAAVSDAEDVGDVEQGSNGARAPLGRAPSRRRAARK
jgi:hypothetical protein